jgi:histone deacetylase 6
MQDDGGYIDAEDTDDRAAQTREVAAYIWENYIEYVEYHDYPALMLILDRPHDATQVFFLGIGAAYIGLVDLLGRYEACTDEDSIVQGLIGFVADNAIQSIKRPTDDHIGTWYYQVSTLPSHPSRSTH